MTRELRRAAPLFAALGDPTRIAILTRLGTARSPQSVTQLAEGGNVTRQAVSKHLRVLESAKLVRGVRRGRETLYRVDPAPLVKASESLQRISEQWGDALQRLKALCEA